jgi:hypothetical protein
MNKTKMKEIDKKNLDDSSSSSLSSSSSNNIFFINEFSKKRNFVSCLSSFYNSFKQSIDIFYCKGINITKWKDIQSH